VSLPLLSLLVSVVAVVFAVAFATVRGLDLFRQMRATGAALGDRLDDLARATDGVALKADRLGRRSDELTASLERLQGSLAGLRVLTTALSDVQARVARVRALAPRK
jgi:hypothetical protein